MAVSCCLIGHCRSSRDTNTVFLRLTNTFTSLFRATITSFLRIHEHGFSDFILYPFAFILLNAPVTQKDRLSERRRIVKIAAHEEVDFRVACVHGPKDTVDLVGVLVAVLAVPVGVP